MRRHIAIALCSLGLGAGSVLAQPQIVPEQTYLLGAPQGLFTFDPTTRQFSTITTINSLSAIRGLTMNAGNVDAAFIFNDRGDQRILKFAPATGVNTLVTSLNGGRPISAMTLDQDGRLVVGGGLSNALLKTTSISNNRLTTLVTGLPGRGIGGICVDDDTGDYVVVTVGPNAAGLVLRVDGRDHSVSTIAAGFDVLNSIDHDQATGRFVLTASRAPHVILLDRAGQVVTTQTLNAPYGLWIDDATGLIHVIDDDRIVILDRLLRVVSQIGPLPIRCQSIALWGSRKFGPAHPAFHAGGVRGERYAATGQFFNSPNRSYVCGISLAGLRPGVRVGSQTINIVPDALFFATVEGRVPFFTSGFVGRTSAGGRFTTSFVVPPLSTTNGLVFFATVVLNPAKPNNLDLASTIAVRVMP